MAVTSLFALFLRRRLGFSDVACPHGFCCITFSFVQFWTEQNSHLRITRRVGLSRQGFRHKSLFNKQKQTNHLIDGPEGKVQKGNTLLNKADQASNQRSWHPNQLDNVQGSIRKAWSGSEQHGLCRGGRRGWAAGDLWVVLRAWHAPTGGREFI